MCEVHADGSISFLLSIQEEVLKIHEVRRNSRKQQIENILSKTFLKLLLPLTDILSFGFYNAHH